MRVGRERAGLLVAELGTQVSSWQLHNVSHVLKSAILDDGYCGPLLKR